MFTPGPWTVIANSDYYGGYRISEAAIEQDTWVSDGYDVSDEEGDRRAALTDERNNGNVKLITAAPDLLTAAERLLADALDREECHNEETGEWFDDWKALSDAIDKAKGLISSDGHRET